jgi:hypothetical protein
LLRSDGRLESKDEECEDPESQDGPTELAVAFELGVGRPEEAPVFNAAEFPACAPEARNVPPGSTISAQTTRTIGSSQTCFAIEGNFGIVARDETFEYRYLISLAVFVAPIY